MHRNQSISPADPRNRAPRRLKVQSGASVNGFCVTAGAEQSEFRLLHSSCYWPTFSIIILANIDTACVVSHLYPLPPPPPHPAPYNREKSERKRDDHYHFHRQGKGTDETKMSCRLPFCASLHCKSGWKSFRGSEIQRATEKTPGMKDPRPTSPSSIQNYNFFSVQSSIPHFNLNLWSVAVACSLLTGALAKQ